MAKTVKAPGAKGTKGGKSQQQAEDSFRSDWRTPPPQPRKRVRKYAAAAPARKPGGGRERPGRAERPALKAPSRSDILRLLKVAGLLVLVGAIAFGMYVLLRLPELAVNTGSVEISGAQRIPPARIYESTGADGRNILLIREENVQSNLLALPGIARVDVHLRLPNRMIVDVVEHAPLLAWHAITTTVWLAEDGEEVPQSGDPPPLTLADETGMGPEESLKVRSLVLKNVIELHANRSDVTELRYGKTEGLYYREPNGWAVWLGDSGPMTNKLALVAEAQQEIASRGQRPTVIDVRLSGRRALYW